MELALNPRETGFVRLNFHELFGNANPVVLEIGSGKGRFLIASPLPPIRPGPTTRPSTGRRGGRFTRCGSGKRECRMQNAETESFLNSQFCVLRSAFKSG